MGIKNIIKFSQVKIKILNLAILENAIYGKRKMFCVLQKKVLSFGPNRTVEVCLNGSAEPNIWSVTNS